MVSRVEFLGEDGWEHGFDIVPGEDAAILDQGIKGDEELYLIKCESDNSRTWVYRLIEGQYRWVTPAKFEVCEVVEPSAMLQCDSTPYESTIFEEEGKHRRAIQITHLAGPTF